MKNTTMTKYKIRKNFLLVAILVSGLLSAVIGAVAYFGMNTGTFVISLDETAYSYGISLSDDKTFTSSYPRLLVNPVNGCYPISYLDVAELVDNVVNTDGDYVDPNNKNFIGYTFYIKNEGGTSLDLSLNVDIVRNTKDVDKVIRVMIIKDGIETSVYEREPENGKHPKDLLPDEYIKYFKSEDVVCSDSLDNFRPEEVIKYSIIVWIDGWYCDDSIQGGQFKMRMSFDVENVRQG